MYKTLRVKYPLFLSGFNETRIIAISIRKILKYQISRKSVQWEQSCSMRMVSLTDMTKLMVVYRNSTKAPKNEPQILETRWSNKIWQAKLLSNERNEDGGEEDSKSGGDYIIIDVVARLRAGRSGIGISAGVSDFRYSKMSKPALGSIQPRIKRVLGDPSEAESGRGVRLTTQLHLVPRLRLNGAIPLFHHTSLWRVKGQLF